MAHVAKAREVVEGPNGSEAAAQNQLIGSLLEASTEYAIIGADLEGNIQVWNEGAQRLYGYESADVVGKANISILDTHEDVAAGLSQLAMAAALQAGKFEGTVTRRRRDGHLGGH